MLIFYGPLGTRINSKEKSAQIRGFSGSTLKKKSLKGNLKRIELI